MSQKPLYFYNVSLQPVRLASMVMGVLCLVETVSLVVPVMLLMVSVRLVVMMAGLGILAMNVSVPKF